MAAAWHQFEPAYLPHRREGCIQQLRLLLQQMLHPGARRPPTHAAMAWCRAAGIWHLSMDHLIEDLDCHLRQATALIKSHLVSAHTAATKRQICDVGDSTSTLQPNKAPDLMHGACRQHARLRPWGWPCKRYTSLLVCLTHCTACCSVSASPCSKCGGHAHSLAPYTAFPSVLALGFTSAVLTSLPDCV